MKEINRINVCLADISNKKFRGGKSEKSRIKKTKKKYYLEDALKKKRIIRNTAAKRIHYKTL